MATIRFGDRVSTLEFNISSICKTDGAGLVRTCVATRRSFIGTLSFDIRCHETNNVVLSKKIYNITVEAWVFGSWQQGREFSTTVEKEDVIGTYIDKEQHVSYMQVYQLLDDLIPGERHVAKYMVKGMRCLSIDPFEIAVPPFHDPNVVEFFCKELYKLIHGRSQYLELPINLHYSLPRQKRKQEDEPAQEDEPYNTHFWQEDEPAQDVV